MADGAKMAEKFFTMVFIDVKWLIVNNKWF